MNSSFADYSSIMSIAQKYLILAPINRWGGVNLDVGFIAQTIGKQHQVSVLSYGKYYEDCSIFNFIDTSIYNSVDRILYTSDTAVRTSVNVLKRFKPMAIPAHHRLDNKLSHLFINIRNKRLKVLRKRISESDKIVICSQLTGHWSEEIVSLAYQYKKPIYYRVTQQISDRHLRPETLKWLRHIQQFIHHSKHNLNVLAEALPSAKHVNIDQCVMWEDQFMEIPLLNQSPKAFYCISRLEKTKQIDHIIKAFKALNDNSLSLHIYGDGSQMTALKDLAEEDNRIKFYGAVALEAIVDVHKAHDCLVIASSIEGGPYTAIEAMAAGRLIVSTNVGAMSVRLGEQYPYFVNEKEGKTLERLLLNITQLPKEGSYTLSAKLREIYDTNYSVEEIQSAYHNALEL